MKLQANPSVSFLGSVEIEQTLEEAFPEADPGIRPFGSRVMVQVRSAKARTRGGIELPFEVQETVAHNTQVAKVVGLGPLAFHNRNTQEEWPEGSWCKVGEFVRIPKFGGDRWEVKHGDGSILFILFNDLDILGAVTGDPRNIRAFV